MNFLMINHTNKNILLVIQNLISLSNIVKYMKIFTEKHIDDLLKLKFGKVVTEPGHTAYISN